MTWAASSGRARWRRPLRAGRSKLTSTTPSRRLAAFTHPTARGRGLAGVVTGAVVAELLAADCRDAILNVAQSNEPARRVYARLGFRAHCPHFERMASS